MRPRQNRRRSRLNRAIGTGHTRRPSRTFHSLKRTLNVYRLRNHGSHLIDLLPTSVRIARSQTWSHKAPAIRSRSSVKASIPAKPKARYASCRTTRYSLKQADRLCWPVSPQTFHLTPMRTMSGNALRNEPPLAAQASAAAHVIPAHTRR